MTVLMQHASPRMSSWASLQQADATCREWNWSKTQTLNTIIFIKSIRQAYLSSADAARSHIVVFDLEMSW